MHSENYRELVLKSLRDNQSQFKEGSSAWREYEKRIAEIIAQNFLEYITR